MKKTVIFSMIAIFAYTVASGYHLSFDTPFEFASPLPHGSGSNYFDCLRYATL